MDFVKQTPPNLTGVPNPEFEKPLFDAAIWQKGYDVTVYKAISCPCKQTNSNTNIPSCRNCDGLGWVFINGIETKAIITSVNTDTKRKQWSTELMGTVNVTLLDRDRKGFMDKIVINEEIELYSETRPLIETLTDKYIFLSYEAESVEDVFLFVNGTTGLVRVPSNQYFIKPENKSVVVFNSGVISQSTNKSISVRYKHRVQYNILDIPHNIRSSNITNHLGQLEKIQLPNAYIARLTHYVLTTKFDGTGIIDNSYTP